MITETAKTKNKFNKSKIEGLGDISLLNFLDTSKIANVSYLAKMIISRNLYKPVYRSKLINVDDNFVNTYELKKSKLTDMGVFDPGRRHLIEYDLATKAKIKDNQIILYCSPKAPGIQKVKYLSESKPGITKSVDESSQIPLEYMKKHLGLWFIYVFVHPELDEVSIKRVSDACKEFFSFDNEIEISLRQQQLYFQFPL